SSDVCSPDLRLDSPSAAGRLRRAPAGDGLTVEARADHAVRAMDRLAPHVRPCPFGQAERPAFAAATARATTRLGRACALARWCKAKSAANPRRAVVNARHGSPSPVSAE